MEPLFAALSPLAPLESNSEVKSIWVQIPRGDASDYGPFEKLKEYGEVDSYEEFIQQWKEDYPDELIWYELTVVESFEKTGKLRFRGVSVDDKLIINATMDGQPAEYNYSENAAVGLCELMTAAAKKAIRKLEDGVYNDEVASSLPYQFRTGVIKRSVVWEKEPDCRKGDMDRLSEETVAEFKRLIASGANDEMKIGRLTQMTANDFFRACAIGYKACGYKGTDAPPVEQYLRYADGRDEGLTGKGAGLNAGTGIDFDDPDAWEQWYFNNDRVGGHPWEVCRGGNSTHVDLLVNHDRHTLDWKVAMGRMSQEEADRHARGYYFSVAGKHRPFEAVNFYVALSAAGLPVFLLDGDEILARCEGTDFIGIVPHNVIPKYCEGMFPAKYGRVIDFIHVYEEDLEEFGGAIEWVPEKEARLALPSDAAKQT